MNGARSLKPGRKRPEKVHLAYLGLGSNIDPARNLPRAVEYLRRTAAVEAVSQVWETPPAGTHGPNFLNAAVLVHTPLLHGLFKNLVLRPIEIQMGRVRTPNKNAPRPIDLDILVFDDQTVDAKLWTQVFNAVPLAELIPDFRNPATGEKLCETAARLSRGAPIKARPDVDLRAPGKGAGTGYHRSMK